MENEKQTKMILKIYQDNDYITTITLYDENQVYKELARALACGLRCQNEKMSKLDYLNNNLKFSRTIYYYDIDENYKQFLDKKVKYEYTFENVQL